MAFTVSFPKAWLEEAQSILPELNSKRIPVFTFITDNVF